MGSATIGLARRGGGVFLAAPLLLAGCMGPAPKADDEVGKGTNLWPVVEVAYDQKGRDTDILWPLLAFHNRIDEKYYAFRPLFMVRTDPADSVNSVDILFPFFHRGRTGTRDEFALRPLVGSWRDPVEGMVDYDFLFPFGYYRHEPEKRWFQLRPLVWYKRTPEEGYFHLIPLYGRNWTGKEDDREDRLWFLTPLFTYWHDEAADPAPWSFDALWPLLHLERGTERDLHRLFPLVWYRRAEDEGYLHVFPFFGRSWEYSKLSKEERLWFLTPLFTYWHDGAADPTPWSFDALWPLLHLERGTDRDLHRFFPLFWYRRAESRGYFHVFPFYGRSWKTMASGNEEDRLWILAPFFTRWHDGSDPRQWTFDGPFPLFHLERKVDRSVSWLFPVFLHGSGKEWSVLGIAFLGWDYRWTDPAGKEDTRNLLVLPFYIGHERGVVDNRFFLLDGYVRMRDAEAGSDSVLFPLFHHKWNATSDWLWIFPVFWKFREPGESTLVIPPFVLHEGKKEILHLWPLFGRFAEGAYREWSTLFPLFWFGSDGIARTSLNILYLLLYGGREAPERWRWSFLFPLGETSRDGGEHHSRLFPLWLRWESEGAKTSHLHVLWPLFRKVREGDELRWRLLLPFITYREKGDEHDFRVLWKWIRSTREPGFSTLRINPFYRSDENARGDSYWSILGGLFSRKVEGGVTGGKVLWVIPW